MNQYGLNLGSPSNFGDWTRYAGFNPNTPVTGMAPIDGGVQPVAPNMQQMSDTFSKIGDQLGSGNFSGAYQTYVGKAPVAPTTQKPTTPQTQPSTLPVGFGIDHEG